MSTFKKACIIGAILVIATFIGAYFKPKAPLTPPRTAAVETPIHVEKGNVASLAGGIASVLLSTPLVQ